MKLIIFYSLKETTMKNKRVSDLPAIARRSLTSLRFRKENWSENYREHCIENEVSIKDFFSKCERNPY